MGRPLPAAMAGPQGRPTRPPRVQGSRVPEAVGGWAASGRHIVDQVSLPAATAGVNKELPSPRRAAGPEKGRWCPRPVVLTTTCARSMARAT